MPYSLWGVVGKKGKGLGGSKGGSNRRNGGGVRMTTSPWCALSALTAPDYQPVTYLAASTSWTLMHCCSSRPWLVL